MSRRRPLYARLLRLRHLQPTGWQRALLSDGTLVLAGLLVLADLATPWALLALPVAVAVVVKAHDVLVGQLRTQACRPRTAKSPPSGAMARPGGRG